MVLDLVDLSEAVCVRGISTLKDRFFKTFSGLALPKLKF